MHAPRDSKHAPRTAAPAAQRPVLLVLHQELSTAGRVGHWLAKHGVPLDIRRPRLGDPLPVPLAEKRPFLGICLGAQMLAKHLGARVSTHPEGKAEVGYYPIRVTEQAHAVCGHWPKVVYQWHREGFELPHGAKLLAEGDLFRVQAMRYGPAAYGIQFHAEVTHAMMCRWTTRGHARMEM